MKGKHKNALVQYGGSDAWSNNECAHEGSDRSGQAAYTLPKIRRHAHTLIKLARASPRVMLAALFG